MTTGRINQVAFTSPWQSIEDARWRDGGRYQPLFQTDPGTCPIKQVL